MIHSVHMTHLLLHYTVSWNVMLYLNATYGLNVIHGIHDLSEIHDLNGCEYMMSNYEKHAMNVIYVIRVLHKLRSTTLYSSLESWRL